MSASSPEKVEQLAAAMAAEREMAAGKSPTSPALFSTPDFPDAGACRLLEAAVTGSLRKTEEALAAGVPAACADANGHTPLHQCAFMGFEAIAKLLIDSDPGCVDARDLCAMAGLEPHTSDPRRICHSSVRALPRTGCATCRCTRPPSATT